MGTRGRSGGPGGPGRGRRRTPPPESTGAEARYLHEKKEHEVALVFHLVTGEILRGVVEYYDRHMIKVRQHDGPGLFVRKSQIRSIQREG